jgi:hypothetical protein
MPLPAKPEGAFCFSGRFPKTLARIPLALAKKSIHDIYSVPPYNPASNAIDSGHFHSEPSRQTAGHLL